jgi:hypothetical protein
MFQRDYSWTEDIWEDLWQDITSVVEDESDDSYHYMGYLVLQKKNGKLLRIIDGQQRLATLSIIILVVIKMLRELAESGIDSDNNLKRGSSLYDRYIGSLDTVTLISSLKLKLNRNNNRLYEKYIANFQDLPGRGLNASEKLLKNVWEWYNKKLHSYFTESHEGEKLAKFLENLTNKLFFTVITVQDEINAYKVFETLNARGLRLSPTDLLKNYLFSVISETGIDDREIKELEDLWTIITGKLENDDFSTFLRVYWNSKYDFVRKNDLYKAVRKTICNKGDVFQLLRQLDQNADYYSAFKNPADELWAGQKDISGRLGELKLFQIRRQPFALLLAAQNRFTGKECEKILRACSIISFRYNVIGGYNPNEQEKVYSKAAKGISEGRLSATDAIRELSPVYPSDEKFRNDFREKSFDVSNSRNRNIVKYILFSIEKHITGNDYDSESARYDIEHILPKNPGENWEGYSENKFINRMGNLTILRKTENRQAGNNHFDEKLQIYKNSNLLITSEIAETSEKWLSDDIARRQDWMAKQASAIWRVDNISD